MVAKSLLCCTVLMGTLIAGDTTAASASGNAVGNMVQGAYGNSAGITNSISAPLMGGGSFKTLDGKNTFTSNVQCPSTIKSVSTQFVPTSGGEWQLLVSQDMDLDGKFDYTYSSSAIGGNISGVCSAGVITCAPNGTWSDDKCRSFIWGVDASRKLTLTPIQNRAKELGSCHCTNSSCGGGVLNANVYDPIAGGIATILMKDSVNYLHSKNEFNQASATLSLFGQDRNNCREIPHGAWDQYGEKHPEKYFATQQPASISIVDVALEQGNDPHSYYSLLSHQNEVAYGKGGETISMPNVSSCSIKNTPTETATNQCKAGLTEDISSGICIDSGHPAQDYNSANAYCNGQGLRFPTASEAKILPPFANQEIWSSYQWFQVAGGCGNYPRTDWVVAYNGNTAYNKLHRIWCNGVWYQSPISAYWCVADKTPQLDVVVSSINQCLSYESDAKCTVQDEQVCDSFGNNCIYTIRNGTKQNISPQRSCITLSYSTSCADGNSINATLNSGVKKVLSNGSEEWFNIKRTYNCGNTDIAIDVSKMDRANRTAYKDPSSTTMQYTDENGNNKSINNLPKGDNCPAPVCTVKKEVYEADVFSDGTNRSQTIGGTKRYEMNMKTCQKSTSSATAKCIVDVGETMIEDCSCTGSKAGMATTLAALAVMDEMLKDKICSEVK